MNEDNFLEHGTTLLVSFEFEVLSEMFVEAVLLPLHSVLLPCEVTYFPLRTLRETSLTAFAFLRKQAGDGRTTK